MLGSLVASDDLAVNGVEMMNTFFLMHAFPYTLYVDYMVCTHILYSQWISDISHTTSVSSKRPPVSPPPSSRTHRTPLGS